MNGILAAMLVLGVWMVAIFVLAKTIKFISAPPSPPTAEANKLMAKNKELERLYREELTHSMRLEKSRPTLNQDQVRALQDEIDRLREENRLMTVSYRNARNGDWVYLPKDRSVRIDS